MNLVTRMLERLHAGRAIRACPWFSWSSCFNLELQSMASIVGRNPWQISLNKAKSKTMQWYISPTTKNAKQCCTPVIAP